MSREEFKGVIECAGGNLLVKKNPPKTGGNFQFKSFVKVTKFLYCCVIDRYTDFSADTRILVSNPTCPTKGKELSSLTTYDMDCLKRCSVQHKLFDA
jgi:hypothetical protein